MLQELCNAVFRSTVGSHAVEIRQPPLSTKGEWWENRRIWTLWRPQLHELDDSEETLYENNVAHDTKILHCEGDNQKSRPSITVCLYTWWSPWQQDISFCHVCLFIQAYPKKIKHLAIKYFSWCPKRGVPN